MYHMQVYDSVSVQHVSNLVCLKRVATVQQGGSKGDNLKQILQGLLTIFIFNVYDYFWEIIWGNEFVLNFFRHSATNSQA